MHAALLIIQAIQAGLAAAPQAIEIIEKGKAMISALFTSGVITKEEQDIIDKQVDAIQALVDSGNIPAHWGVEPDPS